MPVNKKKKEIEKENKINIFLPECQPCISNFKQ